MKTRRRHNWFVIVVVAIVAGFLVNVVVVEWVAPRFTGDSSRQASIGNVVGVLAIVLAGVAMFSRRRPERPEKAAAEPFVREPAWTPRFPTMVRGYDRRQVDTYLDRIEAEGFSSPVPDFVFVLRGYDPRQVDARIQEIRAQSRG